MLMGGREVTVVNCVKEDDGPGHKAIKQVRRGAGPGLHGRPFLCLPPASPPPAHGHLIRPPPRHALIHRPT